MKYLKSYIYILKLTIKTIPMWSFFTVFNNIFGVVCNLLNSVVLLNIVLSGIANNRSVVQVVIPVVVIEMIVMIAGMCTSIYYGKIDPIARQLLHKTITKKILNSAMETEIKNLDDAKYLDKFTFAMNQVEKRTTGSVYLLANLLSNCTGVLLAILAIGFINIKLIILIAAVISFSLLLSSLLTKVNYKYDSEIVESQRKKNYVERTYHMKKYALEIRLYPISNFLTKIYDGAIKNIFQIIKKYGIKIGLLNFLQTYNQEIFLYWGAMIVCIICLFEDKFSMGATNIIPATVAICSLSNYLVSLIGTFNSLKENELYSKGLISIIHSDVISEQKKHINERKTHEIEFHSVEFKYDAESQFGLKNINMKFPPGKKIAIVGANGSGKSTLIKLMMGLYTPCEGKITIDGEPISNFNEREYRGLFTFVQQNIQEYPCTVAENVVMDDSINHDIKRIIDSLSSVELDEIMLIDDFLNKNITSEFTTEGIKLSQGQYQKLALARVFATDRNIIVLDEPTSSMDPISEYKIFKKLLDTHKDGTVVIISHRLTATKNADMIYVVDEGRIIESGDHHSLMKSGGKYSEMYTLQAKKYV